MIDVLLIHAPISFENRDTPLGDQTSNPPIGLLYIASYLEKEGFNVKVIDPVPQGLSLKKVINEIKKYKPKIIGISAVTFGTRSAVEIAKKIKENFGNKIPIGLGGMHISCDPDFIKRYPYFDFGVIGEGEEVMAKLTKKAIEKKKIKGIYEAQIIKNLDDLPFPARHLVNPSNYYPPHGKKTGKPVATMISSRGCPYRCTFCSQPKNRAAYRIRSGKNIVDEMEKIYDYCDGKYSFVCDTMTMYKQKTIDMCNEIIKRKLKVKWLANTRVNLVDEELIAKMAEAGCTDLFFGVESGNSHIRNDVVHKNITDRQIETAMKLCWKYKIQSNIYMMLGFPTETKKEIEDSITYPTKIGADVMGIHITWPQPGSPLYDEAIRDKIIPKTVVDDYVQGKYGESVTAYWPVYVPKGLELRDLVEAKKRAYRKFYLRPAWLIRRLQWYFKTPEKFFSDFGEIGAVLSALFTGATGSVES